MNKKGPVGPTSIIDPKFDILDFSKTAIRHVVHFVLFVDVEFLKSLKPSTFLSIS